MNKNVLLVLPLLLLGNGQALGTTTEQDADGYKRVIMLREAPRKTLPQPVECPTDAAVAAYHRPAQSGVVAHCAETPAEPVTGRKIPVSVHSAP